MESYVLKEEAQEIIEKMGLGKKATNHKFREWVFSRQLTVRTAVPVPEEELPLTLPEVEKYEPTGTGESLLADIDEWVNTTCPVCGKPVRDKHYASVGRVLLVCRTCGASCIPDSTQSSCMTSAQ